MPPLALPMKFTVKGICPDVGDAVIAAPRGALAVTVILTVALAVREALSVTANVTVKFPAVE